MRDYRKSSKLTAADQLLDRLLQVAPWIAFLLIALPAPLYFLFRSFTSVDEAGVYVLLALTSLVAGSFVGFIVALGLILYRRAQKNQLRDRLAADGITADEVSLFAPEMTRNERRALKQIEQHNALLADAYRETLAARITASRVIKRAERELATVKNQSQRSASLEPSRATELRRELTIDREKLDGIINASRSRRAEAEAQLQTIEAAAARGATQDEIKVALERLNASRGQAPYALDAARMQQDALKEAERELRLLENADGAK